VDLPSRLLGQGQPDAEDYDLAEVASVYDTLAAQLANLA
jgi:hypothetical protein